MGVGFLYFVSGARTLGEASEVLKGLGLWERLCGASHVYSKSGPGAGGEGGLVVGGSGDLPVGYFPEEQEWVSAGGVELGWGVGRRPGPDDLVVAEPVEGYLVELGDGHRWLVPKARCFPVGTALPSSLNIGVGGSVVSRVLPAFAGLSARAEAIWRGYGDGSFRMPAEEAYGLAADALGVNYVVSGVECSALNLFTTNNLKVLFHRLVDIPSLEAWLESSGPEAQKKIAFAMRGLSGLADGEMELSGAISRHTGNC